MSLFFENEINKVKKNTDRSGLKNLTSQDPRNKEDWSNKSFDVFSQRFKRDAGNRPDSWWYKG